MDAFAGILGAVLAAGTVSPEQELAVAKWWADAAFMGIDAPPRVIGPGIEVLQQTHGTLRVNESVWGTPLRIGGRTYERGIGTHASSRLRVVLPSGAARFRANVGIDSNRDTVGGRGSAEFIVQDSQGEELFCCGLLRGWEAGAEIDVDLEGASEFFLIVSDGGDGPACDQADWAEARVELQEGAVAYLDELPVLRGPCELERDIPFSFAYGGVPSGDFLDGWHRSVAESADGNRQDVSFTDPDTGLCVTCSVRRFDDAPAVDWILEFANEGDAETPIIEDILALDLDVAMPPGELVYVHHGRGSTCDVSDFLPMERRLGAGDDMTLAPVGGRSSNGVLPFLNVAWGTGGVVAAIGWSGQWEASIARQEAEKLQVTAGLQDAALKLKPGESIRTSRILLVRWQGEDWVRGNNLLRRLLLAEYCPRSDGQLRIPPVSHPTSASILTSGKGSNEQTQMASLEAAADIGCEAFWLDAYWFPGGFPGGVGNWFPRHEDFPNGLRPLSEAAHEAGMKFILWFEPGRVARGTRIAREHPEYCLSAGEGDLLYNFALPEAREYMTELLSSAIDEHGVDIYREDFNIDPLPFWRDADPPDRRGMTEIRWVEGFYRMWDELRERHPGLAIDNCASGGRRIDLETTMRSYPLWRSDYQDTAIFSVASRRNAAIAGQVQSVGLGLYVPLSTCALWSFDPYEFRSAMGTGTQVYMDIRELNEGQREQARAAIAELKETRKYFLGDLYPLTEVTTSAADWCAYQCHRPDLEEGIAVFFRRRNSPHVTMQADLRGIDAGREYEFAIAGDYSRPQWQEIDGEELAGLEVRITEAPGSALLRYRRQAAE